jgi:hypothetical protein
MNYVLVLVSAGLELFFAGAILSVKIGARWKEGDGSTEEIVRKSFSGLGEIGLCGFFGCNR